MRCTNLWLEPTVKKCRFHNNQNGFFINLILKGDNVHIKNWSANHIREVVRELQFVVSDCWLSSGVAAGCRGLKDGFVFALARFGHRYDDRF